MLVFGTRPEAIKMAPIWLAARETEGLEVMTCVTAQHREMLDQINGFFGLRPDFDLNLMKAGQNLFDLTADCLRGLREVYEKSRPEMVLVQGDTTTAFTAALAAHYARIPVAHVEAGLRTDDIWAPYPEEFNRRGIAPLAELHFAPTQAAVENLRRENIRAERIFRTGNTSIDALLWASRHLRPGEELKKICSGRPYVLMTAHRRENFGEPLETIFRTVKSFARKHPELQIVYPVHPNPNVMEPAWRNLGEEPNVSLIAPVGYSELVQLLRDCLFLLTDSGGLQEEAPAVGKPTLVLRESTERPEAVSAGCAKLVGHDPDLLFSSMEMLSDPASELYRTMARAANPFGDGTAGRQIVTIVRGHGV